MWLEKKRFHFLIYFSMGMLCFWWLCGQPHSWYMYYSITFPTSSWTFFGVANVHIYDFSFLHGFQALPFELANVQTNTSLLLKETKSCLNSCWSQWFKITFKIFTILPNFFQKLQMTLIFMMMMTCLMSLLVSSKIYLVNKCLWVFQNFHISNSWLIFIAVVSKSSCN